jgi:hypothetical protein
LLSIDPSLLANAIDKFSAWVSLMRVGETYGSTTAQHELMIGPLIGALAVSSP